MAKFLTGNQLNAELETLFENADSQLILISPFIKLHDRYISTLRTKIKNDKLQIIIVFGKNEDDLSRSMKKEDFNFFKEFPNIQIRYEKRLHAKYYATEDGAIISSMNLYSYSQDNNIETGILTKTSSLGSIANTLISNVNGTEGLDGQTWSYFQRVIEQSELLFHKSPQYDKVAFGFGKKYTSSNVEVDLLSDFFEGRLKPEGPARKDIYRKQVDYSKKSNEKFVQAESNAFVEKSRGTRGDVNENHNGYCIRSGTPIPFNPEKPLSNPSYKTWSQFGNTDYQENFCHFSGEPSNGETSYAKPILRKNWSLAKRILK